MAMENCDIKRQSIRYSPKSNTELNGERLPDPKSLAGMELRYRAEPASFVLEERPLAAVALCSIVGLGYTFAWHSSPKVAAWLWLEAHQVEGMPVVGGMLATLIAIVAALALFIVPKEIRRGLAAFSLPLAAVTVSGASGRAAEASIVLSLGIGVCGLAFRHSMLRFYRSWLIADPRMTRILESLWHSQARQGWSLPALSETGRILQRFLIYGNSEPDAPGIWIAPFSRSLRVSLLALLVGSEFGFGLGVVAMALPLAVKTLFFCLAAAAPLLIILWAAGEASFLTRACETHLQNDQRSSFERLSARLRDSQHIATDAVTGVPIREAEHLFLGFEPWQRFPILLHEPMLYEHVHISGRTGSGKTSIALMQKLIQLIRGHRKKDGGWSDKTPIVIIDLRGDEVLFQTAKAEAEARGQRFRFFTLEPGKASFYFNPFIGFKSATLTVPQLVQLNLDALDLNHGTGYGRGYYSQRSRFLLSQGLRNPKGVDSFQDLYTRLRTLYAQHPEDFRDAFELLAVIESLTHYDQLITSPVQEQADETIRLDRVLEDREVVYFWLPSAKESSIVAQVGKLVLFNLRTAAHDRQSAGKEKRQTFLMIDEFQKLAGENFQQILQQARSAGIAAILANQSLADLITPDWDLTPTIRTNTRLKMYFSVTEPEEIKTFRELSGEEIQIFGSNDTEEIRYRLSAKELVSLSDHPKRLLVQISSGSGYSQFGGLPIPVETDWPISKELSDYRAALPWPRSPIVVKQAVPSKPQNATPLPSSTVVQGQASSTANTQPATPSGTMVTAAGPAVPAPSVALPVSATPPVPPAPNPAVHPTSGPSTVPIPLPHPTTPAAKPPLTQGTCAIPAPKKKGSPKSKVNQQTPRPKPTPAVKQAFAQKIQSLMNE